MSLIKPHQDWHKKPSVAPQCYLFIRVNEYLAPIHNKIKHLLYICSSVSPSLQSFPEDAGTMTSFLKTRHH